MPFINWLFRWFWVCPAGIHNTLEYARLHQENVVGHISYTDGN